MTTLFKAYLKEKGLAEKNNLAQGSESKFGEVLTKSANPTSPDGCCGNGGCTCLDKEEPTFNFRP